MEFVDAKQWPHGRGNGVHFEGTKGWITTFYGGAAKAGEQVIDVHHAAQAGAPMPRHGTAHVAHGGPVAVGQVGLDLGQHVAPLGAQLAHVAGHLVAQRGAAARRRAA